MEPLSPTPDCPHGEDCLALMKVERHTFPPTGVWPEYKTMSELPGNVVYGLKVWVIDRAVHYSKRLKYEGVKGLRLRQESNDEQSWNSSGFWVSPRRAGEEDLDWDLYRFLVHRDVDWLWWTLMGSSPAPEGQFFLHFQTEFEV